MRQDERLLVTAVNELADGTVSQESTAFLLSLNRPLQVPPNKKKVLFPHNKTAAIYNLQQLALWEGEEQVFLSSDKGDSIGLERIKVAKVHYFPI